MSANLFPSIVGAHWRAAMQRAKEPNRVMEKIAHFTLQQGNGDGAGLRGRSDAGDARCSAASHFESGGVESRHAQNANSVNGQASQWGRMLAHRTSGPNKQTVPALAGVAPGPLSILSPEPKEGSRHALSNTQHPAPSDYGVGSHGLTFAATAKRSLARNWGIG